VEVRGGGPAIGSLRGTTAARRSTRFCTPPLGCVLFYGVCIRAFTFEAQLSTRVEEAEGYDRNPLVCLSRLKACRPPTVAKIITCRVDKTIIHQYRAHNRMG